MGIDKALLVLWLYWADANVSNDHTSGNKDFRAIKNKDKR
jgi:hypothetical protein